MRSGKDESLFVSDRDETKESCGLHGSPLSARAVRQRHHDRLQILAHDLELANALKLHRLAGQVLLRRDRVGEDVEKHRPTARSMNSEGDHIVHNGLE